MAFYRMSTRKKLAIATWSSPREGNIYGKLTLDLTKTLQYIDILRQKGQRITITHIVGNAAGKALKRTPDLNGRIVWGRYVPHETADIAFLVSLDGGGDLAKVKVCDVDKKTNLDIANELKARAENLRCGKDEAFERSKPMLRWMPTWLLRPLVWAIGYVVGAIGMEIKALGLEKFPFGSCIVTSVGMFGIDEGYAPPTPFARVPVYLAITRIKERPVARNGQMIIRPELDLMATIDHRFIDGHQGAMLAKQMRELIESPWLLDGLSEMPAS